MNGKLDRRVRWNHHLNRSEFTTNQTNHTLPYLRSPAPQIQGNVLPASFHREQTEAHRFWSGTQTIIFPLVHLEAQQLSGRNRRKRLQKR